MSSPRFKPRSTQLQMAILSYAVIVGVCAGVLVLLDAFAGAAACPDLGVTLVVVAGVRVYETMDMI